ncbi:peptidyl-prolyl cis-trans isomerase [Pendulispora albinea]|uniref:peptidylprolyl isomerase n=1 Tax=Pendulispora albinea TaxID=2741071 RepID=A0ABZ2LUP4_9BACT
MGRSRIILATLLLGLAPLAVASAGCNGKSHGQAAGDAAVRPSGGSLTPEEAAQVLVKVGTKTITLGEYAATLEQMDQFDRLRYQSPERRKELLQEMIQIELLAEEAAAKGYDKDPAADRDRRAIVREAFLARARKGSPSPNEVPEAEVRTYYEAHRADYRDPERRRASVIVLRDEASARALLDGARKASAAEWGELVRKKSLDPSAKNNVPVDLAGDVGMVSPPGDPRGENPRIPAEVRAALFAIGNVGDVHAKPVVSGGKAYLVRLTQKADARERSFAEAERTIRIKLAQDKMQAKESELLASLRAQYPVQIDEAALAAVKVELDAGKRN